MKSIREEVSFSTSRKYSQYQFFRQFFAFMSPSFQPSFFPFPKSTSWGSGEWNGIAINCCVWLVFFEKLPMPTMISGRFLRSPWNISKSHFRK